jgi:hypothetical protein
MKRLIVMQVGAGFKPAPIQYDYKSLRNVANTAVQDDEVK